MRKKIICVLVALILSFCLVGLTACFLPTIPQNNGQETEKNNIDKNSNSELEDTSKDNTQNDSEGSDNTSTILVKGKTFVFDLIAIQHVSVIFPEEVIANIADDDSEETAPPLTTEENILTLQMLQEQINDIYALYTGSTLTFKDNNIAKHALTDGTIYEYEYKQKLSYIALGDLSNLGTSMTGQVDTETLILEMYITEYTLVIMQFSAI